MKVSLESNGLHLMFVLLNNNGALVADGICINYVLHECINAKPLEEEDVGACILKKQIAAWSSINVEVFLVLMASLTRFPRWSRPWKSWPLALQNSSNFVGHNATSERSVKIQLWSCASWREASLAQLCIERWTYWDCGYKEFLCHKVLPNFPMW